MSFEPWTEGIAPDERLARLRSLRAMTILMYCSHGDLIAALKKAEREADWLPRALDELERIPSLHRRRLLSSYCNLFGVGAT
jgi:hypothetical protein